MSGSLGSLVVEVAATVARFQSDMGRVAYIAQQNANLVQRAFDTVGNSLKALGAGLSSMAVFILMAVVLLWRPRGLFPAHA